jgi:hypothetical protein
MGASAVNITIVGFDLAEIVFPVHGVAARSKAVLRRQLRREQVVAFFVSVPSCVIGMETCAPQLPRSHDTGLEQSVGSLPIDGCQLNFDDE